MTPWHRFWFPDDAAAERVPRDTAPWSPYALAQMQQSLWHQAAEATVHWWRFVSIAWPPLPTQATPGSVQPLHTPDTATAPARATQSSPSVRLGSTRSRPSAPRKAAASAKRPRSVSRGK